MSEWKQIPGYEDLYLASSDGEILSKKRPSSAGGLLKQHVNQNGYLIVKLTKQGQTRTHTVHKLVTAAFYGVRPEGLEVRHLNGDRTDCRVANLKYGTRPENSYDKRGHGTDHNVNKTHCPQGHPYDEVNTYVLSSRPNARYCRECQKKHAREKMQRRRDRYKAAGLNSKGKPLQTPNG